MRITAYSVIILFLLASNACNNADTYAAKAKTLDSLSGALNSMVSSINKIDTALLERALARYSHYYQFIAQNGTDTLARSEANELRSFVNCGASLKAVKTNRRMLLNRATQVNTQLTALTDDVKKRSIRSDDLHLISQREINEANKLILMGNEQQKIFFSAIETFKNSIPAVEQVIRRRNSGELPVVISASEAL